MSEVLYRKYRPQRFADVISQRHVRTILQNALRSGRISHAYLFAGPRGVGKTTMARILAKALNCEHPKKGEPDTKCENCQAIQNGRFLDLVEIDAASYTGVDNIREVIEHVKFAPSRGKHKVFIIDEAHMLSKSAFNALLKTLEEPPEHAVFVLATTEPHKVPATIVSRTQRFDFKTASVADLVELLERVLSDSETEVAPETQRLLAQAASGSFRDALSILDQVLSFTEGEVTTEQVEDILGITRVAVHQRLLGFLLKSDRAEALDLVRKLTDEGKDPVQFSKDFLEYLRQILLVKTGVEKLSDTGLSGDQTEQLKKQAAELSSADLLRIIKEFLEAHRESRGTPVPELPLLSAVMALTKNSPARKAFSAAEDSLDRPKSGPENRTSEKISVDVKEEKEEPVSKSEIDMGTVMDQWADVLKRVKEYNHSLISSLRLGRLVSVNQKEVVVAFPYSFHKETIEARKNKIVVEQVLEDVFGKRLKVRPLLEKEVKKNEEAVSGDSDLLSEAMKVLGTES